MSKILGYFTLPLLLLLSNSSGHSASQAPARASNGQDGTRERMIVSTGNVAMQIDLQRLRGIRSKTEESKRESVRFEVSIMKSLTVALSGYGCM